MILIGPIFYFLASHKSFTAFLPTALGVVILIFGLIARDPNKRKFGMHGAVGVALLGFLASLSRYRPIINGFTGVEGASAYAATATVLMALLCLILVIMGVRSFILARRVL